MGIGRREFLQLFGVGIAAARNPAAAIAILDDQYINRRLGIAFEKPNGWVFANVKQMADVKAGQVLDLDVESCATILKRFKVTSDPTSATVSACDAASYEASFIFEHENPEPTPVRMKTLVIDQGTAFYTLRMYDSPYLGEGMAFDFGQFMASVRMV